MTIRKEQVRAVLERVKEQGRKALDRTRMRNRLRRVRDSAAARGLGQVGR